MISSPNNRIQYVGNGVTVSFAFPYLFYDNSHLVVTITDTDGVEQPAVGFTVTGAGNQNGGQVVFVVPPTVDYLVTIVRQVPLTQLMHYLSQDDFPAASHERALDLLTMIVQQLLEKVNRAVRTTL